MGGAGQCMMSEKRGPVLVSVFEDLQMAIRRRVTELTFSSTWSWLMARAVKVLHCSPTLPDIALARGIKPERS